MKAFDSLKKFSLHQLLLHQTIRSFQIRAKELSLHTIDELDFPHRNKQTNRTATKYSVTLSGVFISVQISNWNTRFGLTRSRNYKIRDQIKIQEILNFSDYECNILTFSKSRTEKSTEGFSILFNRFWRY